MSRYDRFEARSQVRAHAAGRDDEVDGTAAVHFAREVESVALTEARYHAGIALLSVTQKVALNDERARHRRGEARSNIGRALGIEIQMVSGQAYR